MVADLRIAIDSAQNPRFCFDLRIASTLSVSKLVTTSPAREAIGVPNDSKRSFMSLPAVRPKSSDSGQRNLLKPALENQSLAVSRMAGFLGKGIRSCTRL